MAVCHPLKPRLLCSPKRVLVASIGVAVLSFLLNSARWLEFEVMEQIGSKGKVVYIPVTTILRKNPNYEKYILINYILLNWLLPIATTLILNSLILCRVKSNETLSKTRIHATLLFLIIFRFTPQIRSEKQCPSPKRMKINCR